MDFVAEISSKDDLPIFLDRDRQAHPYGASWHNLLLRLRRANAPLVGCMQALPCRCRHFAVFAVAWACNQIVSEIRVGSARIEVEVQLCVL